MYMRNELALVVIKKEKAKKNGVQRYIFGLLLYQILHKSRV